MARTWWTQGGHEPLLDQWNRSSLLIFLRRRLHGQPVSPKNAKKVQLWPNVFANWPYSPKCKHAISSSTIGAVQQLSFFVALSGWV